MRITRLKQIIKEEIEKAFLGEEEQIPDEEEEALANFTKGIRSSTKSLLDRNQVQSAMKAVGEELAKYKGRDKAIVLAAVADSLGIDPNELAALAKLIDTSVKE